MARPKPLPAPPLPEKLAALASWVDLHDRETAEWLRAAAANHGPPIDRDWVRKQALRRIWRLHLPGLPRSVAARQISAAWSIADEAESVPGSLDDMLGRLARDGFRPLAWRRIDELLDPALDG